MKLKSCPFCGGKAGFDESKEGGIYIECEDCHSGSCMMFPDKCDVRPLLAERWNARASAGSILSTSNPPYLPDGRAALAAAEAKEKEGGK